MSDHDFEKQVQQRMDELKLRPSASVWQGVEAELNKDKRRRRGLLWLPLLFIMLGAGGFFIFQPGKEQRTKQSQVVLKNIPSSESKTANELSSDSRIQYPDQKPADQIPSADKKNATRQNNELEKSESNERVEERVNDDSNDSEMEKNRQNQRLPKSALAIRNKPTIQSNKNEGNNNKIAKQQSGKDNLLQQDRRDPLIVSSRPPVDQSIVVTDDSIAKPFTDPDSSNKDVAAQDTSNNEAPLMALVKSSDKKKESKNRRWQLGVNASAGISYIKDGSAFQFQQAAVSDISTTSPNSNMMPQFGIFYKPAVIKPRLAYSVSLFAQKQISNRIALSIGLGYSQFNTSTEVGHRVDSARIVNYGSLGFESVRSYYTPDQTNEYTMRYHFIDLPVNMQYRLNNSKSLPVFWNVGIATSRLISTNALHFDGSTGVYFKNNDLFNKYHVGVSSGFSVSLLNKTKMPISVGPVVRYQLSNMLHKKVSDGKHLMSFGLNFKMLIKK